MDDIIVHLREEIEVDDSLPRYQEQHSLSRVNLGVLQKREHSLDGMSAPQPYESINNGVYHFVAIHPFE